MANDILTFCGTDTGTNLLTQSDYNLSADRTSGNKPGVASAKLVNKALRQSAFIASQLAQFLADKTGDSVLDDNNTANLLATIGKAFTSIQTAYAAKTTTYAVLASDQVLSGATAGGAFTMTLPTAVGRTGKVYTFKKTDSSFNGLTIATTSAQTIDGSTTRVMYTLNETLTVISNGANWLILDHKCDTDWTAYTLVPTGSGSNPTIGTATTNHAWWRRSGDSILIRFNLVTTGAGTEGTGDYKFPIPSGLTMDTAKIDVSSTGQQSSGQVGFFRTATDTYDMTVTPYDSTNVCLYNTSRIANAGTAVSLTSRIMNGTTGSWFNNSALNLSFTASVPITGWFA